jgi:hypothetical protein
MSLLLNAEKKNSFQRRDSLAPDDPDRVHGNRPTTKEADICHEFSCIRRDYR